ncbi:hypothetical protein GQ53DRAFT_832465 [Thozetella sp. PMI_491]|nr:hypothetical protein GQ53DRAFT_832465 [Thozetella sp. PMI_491]
MSTESDETLLPFWGIPKKNLPLDDMACAVTSRSKVSLLDGGRYLFFSGELIDVDHSDRPKYPIGFMNAVLQPRNDKAELVVWVEDFQRTSGRCIIHFKDLLVPMWEHVTKGTIPPLELSHTQRRSLACYSFSEQQQGLFSLRLKSIISLRPGQPDHGRPLLGPAYAEVQSTRVGPGAICTVARSEAQTTAACPQPSDSPAQAPHLDPTHHRRERW